MAPRRYDAVTNDLRELADLPPSERGGLVGQFGQLYLEDQRTWRMEWFGQPVIQNPFDVWAIQEIMWDTRPQVLIETGTHAGGSATMWSWLLSACGGDQIITIDIEALHASPEGVLPINYLEGSSTDPAIVDRVTELVGGRRAMVILDSDHTPAHVTAELELYSPLVSRGCYLVCQDTFIGGHPVDIDAYGGGRGPR